MHGSNLFTFVFLAAQLTELASLARSLRRLDIQPSGEWVVTFCAAFGAHIAAARHRRMAAAERHAAASAAVEASGDGSDTACSTSSGTASGTGAAAWGGASARSRAVQALLRDVSRSSPVPLRQLRALRGALQAWGAALPRRIRSGMAWRALRQASWLHRRLRIAAAAQQATISAGGEETCTTAALQQVMPARKGRGTAAVAGGSSGERRGKPRAARGGVAATGRVAIATADGIKDSSVGKTHRSRGRRHADR